MQSFCPHIRPLPLHLVPEKGPPTKRFEVLKEAVLNEQAVPGCAHYHYSGSWLSLVTEIMSEYPENLAFRVFRDEFLDAKGAPLANAGIWLRRRTAASGVELIIQTSLPSSTGVKYPEVCEVSSTSTSEVEDVESSFPLVVAWYDCLRLSYTTSRVRLNFDLARLGVDRFYLSTTTTFIDALGDPPLSAQQLIPPLHPLSKALEALSYQNDKYYQTLLSTGTLGKQSYSAGHCMHLSEVDPALHSQFDSFAESLMADDQEYL